MQMNARKFQIFQFVILFISLYPFSFLQAYEERKPLDSAIHSESFPYRDLPSANHAILQLMLSEVYFPKNGAINFDFLLPFSLYISKFRTQYDRFLQYLLSQTYFPENNFDSTGLLTKIPIEIPREEFLTPPILIPPPSISNALRSSHDLIDRLLSHGSSDPRDNYEPLNPQFQSEMNPEDRFLQYLLSQSHFPENNFDSASLLTEIPREIPREEFLTPSISNDLRSSHDLIDRLLSHGSSDPSHSYNDHYGPLNPQFQSEMNPENTIMITQREVATTSSNSAHPILATFAISECIGIAIYDTQHHLAGLAHIDSGISFEQVWLLIQRTSPQQRDMNNIVINLITGCSSSRINDLELFLQNSGYTNIRSQTVNSAATFAIDARTGEVGQFRFSPIQLDRFDRESLLRRSQQIDPYFKKPQI